LYLQHWLGYGHQESANKIFAQLKMEKWKQWKRISRKQSTRLQHLSQLKASAFFSFAKKYLLRNTTTYTWDW
jgi:hypothetical protein